MAKKWPENGESMDNSLENPFPGHFWTIFATAKLGAVFHLVSHFFPISGFRDVFRTGPTESQVWRPRPDRILEEGAFCAGCSSRRVRAGLSLIATGQAYWGHTSAGVRQARRGLVEWPRVKGPNGGLANGLEFM